MKGNSRAAWADRPCMLRRLFSSASPMSAVSKTSLIRALREETNASLKECQEAVAQSGHDLNLARNCLKELLKLKGEKIEAKCQERGKEGSVSLFRNENSLFMSLISCTTDFAANSPLMANLHEKCRDLALKAPNSLDKSIFIQDVQVTTGLLQEPIQVEDAEIWRLEPGHLLGTYVHQAKSPGIGSLAAAIEVKPSAATMDESQHTEISHKICSQLAQHVAAMNPQSIPDLLSQQFIFHDKSVLDLVNQFSLTIVRFKRVSAKN